jgi:hypothetical protein
LGLTSTTTSYKNRYFYGGSGIDYLYGSNDAYTIDRIYGHIGNGTSQLSSSGRRKL